MAAQILRRGQAIVWVPPRAIGERAFASEASLLALLPIAAMETLLSGMGESAVTVEGSGSAARYARVSFDALPALKSVTLVFDARDVTLLRAVVPPLSGARQQQALPNIAEDSLLQDPQQCGFALGPRSGEDERLIAAIDRSWLEHVIGAFERRGARVQAAWPAQLVLPLGDASAALGCLNSGLALRTGTLEGLGWNASEDVGQRAEAIVSLLQAAWIEPPATAGEPLDAEPALAAQAPVRPLTVFVDGPEWEPAVMHAAGQLGISADVRSLPLPSAAPIDLLAARRGSAARRWLADIDWRDWRLPAALAMATVAVAIMGGTA
ncbi:MAG: type II secretion system protein GspL [Gammaproteobacteria bacterium]